MDREESGGESMNRVKGKVALVTGAARGQGRSHCVRLASEGADIIGIDNCADVEKVAYRGATMADFNETVRLVEELGGRMVARTADVRDFDSLVTAVADGVAQFGGLDIVCANAGIITTPTPTLLMEESDWRVAIDVNLTGVWLTCKAAVPYVVEGGKGGSVVLISSLAGLQGHPNIANYVAAKHGLVGLMRTLALELAPQMIRVNSIHPTQINTPMIMNDVTKKLFVPDKENPSDEEFANASQQSQAMPIPWVESIDVSNALLFLASDEARYITGVALPLDGGALLK
jgi:SDR family mycofactocin-dependent oxidoreductase